MYFFFNSDLGKLAKPSHQMELAKSKEECIIKTSRRWSLVWIVGSYEVAVTVQRCTDSPIASMGFEGLVLLFVGINFTHAVLEIGLGI